MKRGDVKSDADKRATSRRVWEQSGGVESDRKVTHESFQVTHTPISVTHTHTQTSPSVLDG